MEVSAIRIASYHATAKAADDGRLVYSDTIRTCHEEPLHADDSRGGDNGFIG